MKLKSFFLRGGGRIANQSQGNMLKDRKVAFQLE